MKLFLKIGLPFVILICGAGIAALMIANRPPVEPREPVVVAPLVRVQIAQPGTSSFRVHSQGTVQPRTDVVLVSEVAGIVTRTAEALAAGGYFEAGEILVEIDPRDYELSVVRVTARLREAEARLLREEAEAEVAHKEWAELGREGTPGPLLLREPQLAEAQALVESARADLELARRELDKTRIRAPFAGRVLRKTADLGQYVTRGSELAKIYAIDAAEVRLPLPAAELAYVDIPFGFRGESGSVLMPEVDLRASLGGKEHTWSGRIVRTEGEIDARTRMITAVAEVKDPYGRKGDGAVPPLASGLFVSAEIHGHTVSNVFNIPRTAFRDDNTLLVVNDRLELEHRPVKILRMDRTNVVVGEGLRAGERICLSALESAVPGMEVRIAEAVDEQGRTVALGGVQ